MNPPRKVYPFPQTHRESFWWMKHKSQQYSRDLSAMCDRDRIFIIRITRQQHTQKIYCSPPPPSYKALYVQQQALYTMWKYLLLSSWITKARRMSGIKTNVMPKKGWLHHGNESRMNKPQRPTKKLQLISSLMTHVASLNPIRAYVGLSKPPSASHHSHCSHRKRDILRFDSPGYIYTPLKEKWIHKNVEEGWRCLKPAECQQGLLLLIVQIPN